jgi:hypothetical protein
VPLITASILEGIIRAVGATNSGSLLVLARSHNSPSVVFGQISCNLPKQSRGGGQLCQRTSFHFQRVFPVANDFDPCGLDSALRPSPENPPEIIPRRDMTRHGGRLWEINPCRVRARSGENPRTIRNLLDLRF